MAEVTENREEETSDFKTLCALTLQRSRSSHHLNKFYNPKLYKPRP